MNMYKKTRKLALISAVSMALITGSSSLVAAEQSSEITEARQSSQIWTTYALNPHLKAHDIKVSVNDGVATLTGKVDEDISKELAEQLAMNVKGISKVNNRIEVDADYQPTKNSGERSYGDMVSDASISATVKSKLLWSKHAQGLAAKVETRSGKVTLDGTADSAEAKQLAGLLASNTHGVSAVENNLKVEKSSGKQDKSGKDKSDMGQSISDTWITTKVKSTLIYSSNVSSSDISVNTRDGVVTLSGNVKDSAERALAIELAKNVKGVKSVNGDALTDQKS
jgi:hyperosmotically inducible periplasmic protein